MDFPGGPPGRDEDRDEPQKPDAEAPNVLDVFGDRTDVPLMVLLFVAALASQTFNSMFCRC
jgi:hypothetical protein